MLVVGVVSKKELTCHGQLGLSTVGCFAQDADNGRLSDGPPSMQIFFSVKETAHRTFRWLVSYAKKFFDIARVLTYVHQSPTDNRDVPVLPCPCFTECHQDIEDRTQQIYAMRGTYVRIVIVVILNYPESVLQACYGKPPIGNKHLSAPENLPSKLTSAL